MMATNAPSEIPKTKESVAFHGKFFMGRSSNTRVLRTKPCMWHIFSFWIILFSGVFHNPGLGVGGQLFQSCSSNNPGDVCASRACTVILKNVKSEPNFKLIQFFLSNSVYCRRTLHQQLGRYFALRRRFGLRHLRTLWWFRPEPRRWLPSENWYQRCFWIEILLRVIPVEISLQESWWRPILLWCPDL